jgi:hypothetical protein
MYWLKGCGRCHGDLHEVYDVGETYVSCIQCGKVLTAEQERALPRPRRTSRQDVRRLRSFGQNSPVAA